MSLRELLRQLHQPLRSTTMTPDHLMGIQMKKWKECSDTTGLPLGTQCLC